MPQARSGGSGSSSSRGSTRRSTSASKSKTTKRASTGSRAKSKTGSTKSRASSSRSTASRSTGARASRSTKSTAGARRKASGATATAEARVDAVAARLRKLNERIIDAGRDAGETTLTNYEKALKTIASTLEKGPGSSDVEWVANLATAQAKFIRDVTTSWTAAARKVLK